MRRVVAAAGAGAVVLAVWAADLGETRRIPLATGRGDVVSRVAADEPLVALTFDDGPHPEVTPAILDLLEVAGARATFFVVGRNADASPGLLGRMVAGGHEVANHTWSHAVLTLLTPAAAAGEIARGAQVIRDLTGRSPALLRPPQGSANETVLRLVKDAGEQAVLWSAELDEGAIRDVPLEDAARQMKAGDIILAHDVCPAVPLAACEALIPRAVARLRAFLDALKDRGVRVVTVSELIVAARG